jgi:hypothetical protein
MTMSSEATIRCSDNIRPTRAAVILQRNSQRFSLFKTVVSSMDD